MKKLTGVLVIAIIVAHCTTTESLRPRRQVDNQPDSGVFTMLGSIVGLLEGIPIVGGIISWGVTWVSDTLTAVEDLTNGGIARFMGGALPCQISLENGVQCTGITPENNLATHLMKIIDQAPLPGFVKTIIESLLKSLLDPAANLIFGGMPTAKR